jgi:hypothetical protein
MKYPVVAELSANGLSHRKHPKFLTQLGVGDLISFTT